MKWTPEIIKVLNEQGSLTVGYLFTHSGLMHSEARKVIKSIVEDFENVRYNSRDHIYIDISQKTKSRKIK